MEDKLREEMIQSIIDSKEFFFIGRFDGKYKLLHSDLSKGEEWLDMIQHFKDKLEDKIVGLKKNKDALNDLLSDEDISLN